MSYARSRRTCPRNLRPARPRGEGLPNARAIVRRLRGEFESGVAFDRGSRGGLMSDDKRTSLLRQFEEGGAVLEWRGGARWRRTAGSSGRKRVAGRVDSGALCSMGRLELRDDQQSPARWFGAVDGGARSVERAVG